MKRGLKGGGVEEGVEVVERYNYYEI